MASRESTIGLQSHRYTFTGPNQRDVEAAASIFGNGISINRNACEPADAALNPVPTDWNRLGFFRYRQVREGTFPGNVTMTNEWRYTGVPYWLPLLLMSIIPIWWGTLFSTRRQRNRRVRLGLCLTCGCDLRAHKPGERCPECGTPIPSTVNHASV